MRISKGATARANKVGRRRAVQNGKEVAIPVHAVSPVSRRDAQRAAAKGRGYIREGGPTK